MRTTPIVKLLIVFAVTFSLATLAGPLSSHFQLPNVPLGHAATQICQTHGSAGQCSEFWYPAGPAMGTELATIFSDGPSEYTALLSATPSIDLTDWPCGPTTTCPSVGSGSTTTITGPVATVSYFEFQFMLANNFWGVNMNFGNSAAGTQLRQGMAHMLDKTLFATNDPTLTGVGTAIDNPLPTSVGGGLPSANPCAWDGNFTESGSQCVVGAAGGTAYHLASATGANSQSWLPAPGSPDLNAAAQHFVNALSTVAGCSAISFSTATSILSIPAGCTSPSAAGHVPTFFIRSDDLARLDMGNAMAEQICYIFTGSYTLPCTYLNFIRGPITAFPGFQTSPTSVGLNWWIYTAGYIGGAFFDSSLYFTYNSQFVDSYNCTGQVGCNAANPFPLSTANGGPCSSKAVASSSAADYMYICSSSYDAITNTMEFAPCLSAPGDPAPGQVNNGPGANCPATTQLSSISAGVQAEDLYGKNAFTIPVYETRDQYGYLNGWTREILASTGLANFFTWLNAYSATPAQANTIRQGFAEDTKSLSPYISSTVWDFYVAGNIYDSLYIANPLSPSQDMNWMTISTTQVPNSGLTYAPPGGTVTTYRFTLIPGLTFQDGTPVTSFDVAFSYLSLLGTGAFQSGGASNVIGITVLGPHQFDFNLNAVGPTTLVGITGLAVFPGKLWTNAPSSWTTGITTCTGAGASACYPVQYGLAGTPSAPTCVLGGCASFAASNMVWDPAKIAPSYDPLASGTLVGSSAWQCNATPPVGGPNCSSNHTQVPGIGGSFTLSANPSYVHSSNNLALWVWASNGNPTGPSTLTYSFASACFNAVGTPVGTSGVPSSYTTGGSSTAQACSHWQEGIGGPSGTVAAGTTGTALSTDAKITYVGGATFAVGNPIVYNVAGGTTFQSTDIVISNPSGTTLTAGTTVLSSDPKLKFFDNPALGSPGVWVNGKSVVYDSDNSGGYDFGDISSSQYANSLGSAIVPSPGIHIPPPPPGGCSASATSGCWLNEGSTQVGIVALRVGYNWISPFNWALSPPTGIGTLPPVLYQPNSTVPLNPASSALCTNAFSSTSTTSGGYDC